MKTPYSSRPQLILILLLSLLSVQLKLKAQGCTPPNITGTAPGTRCGVGTVTLGVSSAPGAVFKWYAASTGGSAIGTGSVFATPTITANTNYYVSAGTVSTRSVAMGAGSDEGPFLPYNFTGYNYGGEKCQYLYTAAELSGAGLTAGNINSLKFELTTAGSNLSGFTVQMGTTTLNAFSYPVTIQGGLSTVYPATTFTPVIGVNTLNFPTPFNWDGVSNVIISVSWSNNNSTNTESNMKYDLMLSDYYSQSFSADNVTAAYMAAYTGSGGPSLDHRIAKVRPLFTLTGSGICESVRTAVTASVNPAPALTISPSGSVCVNAIRQLSVTSTVSDYDSYTWSPASGLYTDAAATVPYTGTSSVVYYKPAAAGNATYTVNAGNSATGCANMATSTLTASAPDFTASLSPGIVCSGAAVTLSATAGANTGNYSWQWSPGGQVGNTVTVNPVNTGTAATPVSYTVNASDPATGCAATKTLSVTVNTLPTLSVTGNPAILCSTGATATLSATGTSTAYAWSNGATATTVAVTPAVTTSYTITGTNSCGSKTAVATVSVGVMPTITASSSSSVICANNSAVLTAGATAGAIYSWSTGSSAPSITVSPTVTTTYTVTGSNACGTATATVLQTVIPCTGLEEMTELSDILLYPNPAREFITIVVPAHVASANALLEVADVLGRQVITERLSAEVTVLRLAELKEGIYTFRLITGDRPVKAVKIIKS